MISQVKEIDAERLLAEKMAKEARAKNNRSY
jgi:hypothetical protein